MRPDNEKVQSPRSTTRAMMKSMEYHVCTSGWYTDQPGYESHTHGHPLCHRKKLIWLQNQSQLVTMSRQYQLITSPPITTRTFTGVLGSMGC
jgi:hypothetical protein